MQAGQPQADQWVLTLEPDPEAYGGRFSVLLEPSVTRAVERGLDLLELDQGANEDLRAVDSLVCLPSPKMTQGLNFEAAFDKTVEALKRDSWRGFDDDDRRIYPTRVSQLRAVRYDSCRGMEGWTTLCLGLDAFFDFHVKHPRIDTTLIETSLRQSEGFFFAKDVLEAKLARESRLFAINWLMIPLTRSIDHLVIHLIDEESELSKVLQNVSQRCPGAIEWIRATS